MEDKNVNGDKDFVELLDRIKKTPIRELIENSGFDGAVKHGPLDESMSIVDKFNNDWQPSEATRERIKRLISSDVYNNSSETAKKIINSLQGEMLMKEKNDYLKAKDKKMNIGESLLMGDSVIEKLNKFLEQIKNSESQDNE